MKKYILIILIGISSVFLFKYVYTYSNVTPKKIYVSLEAKVLKDDTFQVFYLQKGVPNYTENYSIHTPVKGSETLQTISFELPIDKTLQAFRIDIGQNTSQDPIEINKVTLHAINKSFDFNLSESFIHNECVTSNNNIFTPITVNGKYDPIFISQFNVEEYYQQLIQSQKTKKPLIITLILFIITFGLLIVYQNKISASNTLDNLYSVIFLVIIITPLYINLLGINSEIDISEKRNTTSVPELRINKHFPKKFEQYYTDNFGLRPILVKWNSIIKIDWFKVSPKPELTLFGLNDFLFYNRKDDAIVDSYTKNEVVTNEQIKNSFDQQIKTKTSLNAKGIEYIVGFFPNKHTVYSEYLPYVMKKQIRSNPSLADQITPYYKQNGFPIIDVRSSLLKAKKEDQLYYKYDTHWNYTGAFVAYQELFKQAYDQLKIAPLSKSDFTINHFPIKSGDLSNMMGISEMRNTEDLAPVYTLKNQNLNYTTIESNEYPSGTIVTTNMNCGNDKTALIFRDSYTVALIQFLSLHFKKVIYVNTDYKNNYLVDPELIDQVKPDVVMWLRVERYLNNLIIK